MARAKAIEQRQTAAIAEKSRLLKNIERSDALKIFQTPYHTKRLVELKDVSIAYGKEPVCGPVSFTVEQGDRIALQGANGSGKSSILKLICGQNIPYTGDFRRGSGLNREAFLSLPGTVKLKKACCSPFWQSWMFRKHR